jgi:hypothetical protein
LNHRGQPRGEDRAPSGRDAGRHDVLVVGPGRSGTTWVGEALGHAAGAMYLHEPDHVVAVPFAGRARAGLGEWPVLESGGPAPADYERLWDAAFGVRPRWPLNSVARRAYAGVPALEKQAIPDPAWHCSSARLRLALRLARPACLRGPGPRVVKSINAAFALDWLLDRYDPQVVLVRRHPLDVLASWWDLHSGESLFKYEDDRAVRPRLQRWQVSPPPRDDYFAEMAWYVGFEMSAYQEAAEANPQIHVATHETLCADPIPEFRRLVANVGLEWSPDCEQYLQASNLPGDGYETKRLAAEQPGKWRTRLTDDQVRVARDTLAPFPIARLYDELTV